MSKKSPGKKRNKNNPKPSPSPEKHQKPLPQTEEIQQAVPVKTPVWVILAGSIFLGIAVIMCVMLVMVNLGGMKLPGCGVGSACEQATSSVWGKIPFGDFEWPVSYIGLAYFMAILGVWLTCNGSFPHIFRYLIRFGAIISLGFLVIIFMKRMICPYCVATHFANFAFWFIMESSRSRQEKWKFAVSFFAVIFIITTVILGVWDRHQKIAIRQKAETDRAVVVKKIIESAKNPARQVDSAAVFTGRYRIGPEEAPIRIVMFTDYQCKDCRAIENQLVQLYNSRDDISISIKHFPFCADCNPAVNKTLHANACWAARAAEASGLLYGPQGFWNMHQWLFDRKGEFRTTEELVDGIRSLGYDPTGFVELLTSDATLQPVLADAKEAGDLGILFTPMIFVNGMELKGWYAPNALINTVNQVSASNPPPRSAKYDHPPTAYEKYIDDWREKPRMTLPEDKQPWVLGPDNATVKVALWGDYQDPDTVEADSVIRDFIGARNDIQYHFRHYPANKDCNPYIKTNHNPLACKTAMAAEAAGSLGGNKGFWKMHLWLMENREHIDDKSLRTAATESGFNANTFMKLLTDTKLEANILDDVEAGKKLPLRSEMRLPPGIYSIPTIIVDQRHIIRWRLDEKSLVKDIILDALENR